MLLDPLTRENDGMAHDRAVERVGDVAMAVIAEPDAAR
jgi:hypothetical protein